MYNRKRHYSIRRRVERWIFSNHSNEIAFLKDLVISLFIIFAFFAVFFILPSIFH